jgi:hypothetical protein
VKTGGDGGRPGVVFFLEDEGGARGLVAGAHDAADPAANAAPRVRRGPLVGTACVHFIRPELQHVVYRTCANRSSVFVVDEILALRCSVTFSAALLSVDRRYLRDRDVFEQFVKTWHVTETK